MPINDNPKNPNVDQIINELFGAFTKTDFPPRTKPKSTEPESNPLTEAQRLLKKAETATPSESQQLIQIADRQIRILELSLAAL
jgi:hypothetical protein